MHFDKVSYEEYAKTREGLPEEQVRKEYDNIILPRRATERSAGYDFYIPYDITINSYKATLMPTGIRWIGDDTSNVLMCVPRSGLGFKYGTRLVNTVGIIDADYCEADNEGHIIVKVMSDSVVHLNAGDRYMQGIILPFLITDNDAPVASERTGGFGSTGK